jgi:hypothetical protein
MKKLVIGFVAVLLLFALPLWSQRSSSAPDFLETLRELLLKEDWSPEEIQALVRQEVDWSQAQVKDAEIVQTCLQYAKDSGEEIGAHEQAQLAKEVAVMAQEMRALGFGEPAIVRTALNGTRDALEELARLRLRKEEGAETGAGDMIRTRLREELQTALHQEAKQMVQARVGEQRNSRPDDLLVPPGPQGPPGDAHPGKKE